MGLMLLICSYHNFDVLYPIEPIGYWEQIMTAAKRYGHRIPVRLMALASLFAVGLSYLTARLVKADIELDLTQSSRRALVSANLPIINIHFDGQHARLSGLVDDELTKQAIAETINHVMGVSSLDNQVEALPAAAETLYETASVEPEFDEEGLYVAEKHHPLEKLNLAEVQFESGSATLLTAAYPTLDRLAMLLNQYKQIQLEIAVHTDNSGIVLGQIAVTQARADTIKHYLVKQSVEPERLIATGYGATLPLAHNDTADGRATNRRVEITVLKDQ